MCCTRAGLDQGWHVYDLYVDFYVSVYVYVYVDVYVSVSDTLSVSVIVHVYVRVFFVSLSTSLCPMCPSPPDCKPSPVQLSQQQWTFTGIPFALQSVCLVECSFTMRRPATFPRPLSHGFSWVSFAATTEINPIMPYSTPIPLWYHLGDQCGRQV